ncbi:MAG: hypothetical protein J5801_04040, partial [Bacteroidales bacterium]|nr:hypothetical protein [Bacteroidales bacterium]
MKKFNNRIAAGLAIVALVSCLAAPLTFTACSNSHPELDITIESDYSSIIDAIGSVNKTLTEKLALLEQAMKEGFADQQEAQEQIRAALESLSGTAGERLGAIEAAVKAQTTALDTKLALIEIALADGFVDNGSALDLLKTAIESLGSGVYERLAAIESAVGSQTTSFEVKL